MRSQTSILFLAGAVLMAQPPVPVAGPNVNMVSGTTWPDGDPFLQRQSEPSIAVSTRNPQHLMAGANDYRTVDLSLTVSDEVGDAWLGVYKSVNGGQTWKSTVLPGCPYAVAQCQTTPPSPLAGLKAASDPTLRSGTNGMIYYSGIAFNRGTNPLGAVFVASYIDDNNVEKISGDPFRYLGTKVIESGTSGRYLDKPWVATDIPRAGAPLCNVGGQQFPAGNVYIVYSVFTGSQSTKIMFSRSTDCGQSWSNPSKLREGNSVNQGTVLAVDPATGAIYAAWRRFQTSSQPHAILVAKSSDFGKTFSKAVEIPGMVPFDQGTTPVSFRTNAFPALAVSYDDLTRVSRVHVAWSQRNVLPGGDARIVMATSLDGKTWNAAGAIDSPAAPLFPSLSGRGHQIMPALTFAAGRLVAVYYDLREDSTSGELVCQGCTSAGQRTEARKLEGNLATNPASGAVFNTAIADAAPAGSPALLRRHTMDVRVAEAFPANNPVFVSSRVSQYLYGSSSAGIGAKAITQLRFNAPNVPLFAQGTLPFIGDYIDISAVPFLPGADGRTWRFNTSRSSNPVFHAVWTDNRDVQPPADGNWTNYTPPGPNCIPGRAGMRNQNIYTAQITDGVSASSLGNAKAINATTPTTFVTTIQNRTNRELTALLTIAAPAGAAASFLKPPAAPQIGNLVTIGPRSSASRPIFVTSTLVATPPITVNIVEQNPPAGQTALSTFSILNPDTFGPPNPDLTLGEQYGGTVTDFSITNVPVTNYDLTNYDLTNYDLTNYDLTNYDLTNTGAPNYDLTNADLTNYDLTNYDLTNYDLTNAALGSTSLVDATWKVTNTGNTTTSYNTKLMLKGALPAGLKTQLILSRVYKTPSASGTGRCTLDELAQKQVLVNVPSPAFLAPSDPTLGLPDVTTAAPTNATVALAPGEQGRMTLRLLGDPVAIAGFLSTAVRPVVVAHPTKVLNLVIASLGSLPDAIFGQPYTVTLQALGGVAPLVWTVAPGSALPAGLQLSSGGVLSGTPAASGAFAFTVTVADSSSPAQGDSLALSLQINDTTAPVITASATIAGGGVYSPGSWTNKSVTVTFSCTDAGSGVATNTSPVTLAADGASQSVSGTCTDVAGNSSSVTFSGINIDKTAPAVTIGVPVSGATYNRGAAVAASYQCSDALSLVASCSGTVASGANIDTATAGSRTFTVTAVDNAGNSASASASYTVVVPYTFAGFYSPLGPAGTFSGGFNMGRTIGIKWQLTDPSGVALTDLGLIQSLSYTPMVCGGAATGGPVSLYPSATGATILRVGGQYIFNWDTTGLAASCYHLRLGLSNGSAPSTDLRLQ